MAAKSLKEKNNTKIWMIVAFNTVLFWSCIKAQTLATGDFSAIGTQAVSLLPAGLAAIVASVLNSLISADVKAMIVFWRYRHALPGHRAFSVHAAKDARVNLSKIAAHFKGEVPDTPEAENAAWYKIYKSVEKHASVDDAHGTFLLLRDYASLSLIFLLGFGLAGFLFGPRDSAIVNALILLVQFLLVTLAARNAGIRLVTNVLAISSSGAPAK